MLKSSFRIRRISFILILLSYSIHLCYSQQFWEEINYPDSIWIWSMNVESNDYMLIGCGGPNIGGVYKSDYDIVNWEFKGPEYQTINFSFTNTGNVVIAIHDMTGREVAVLADEGMLAGDHQITWEAGAEVPNGIYFCTISTVDHKLTQKVMLSR